VEQSRLLAERAIYYAQRVPIIVDLQLDRSLNRIAVDPDTRKLLAQTASISTSAERFAAVAEALPDQFSEEREALIRQLAELLTTQQATLLPMLVELRGALEAGHLTATSVDGAARSIDTLVARLKAPPGAGTTPGRPFDITEYTQAADGITRTAVELQQLIGSIDAQAPQLGGTLAASVAKGQSLVDYFFVRVAWLIALLCVGLLVTLLTYRWLAPRVRAS
jgi:ABC-type transporter Mla subunit MlaD